MSTRQVPVADDLYALKFVGDPRVAPGGHDVVFVTTIADRERNDYRSQLWLVPAPGGAAPRPLTSGQWRDTQPRWSPDGRRIAFVSDRTPQVRPAGVGPDDPCKPQVWLLDLAGGEAQQLTALRQGASDPVWSPDGAQLVVTSTVGGPDDEQPDPALSKEERAKQRAERVREITTLKYKFDGLGYLDDKRRQLFALTISAPGASLPAARRLTTDNWNNGQAAWSPDGQQLAFVSYREDDEDATFRNDLWVMQLADGTCLKLTGSQGSVSSPAWSPDGQQIAFFGHQEGEGNAAMNRLWTVVADGSAPPVCQSAQFDRDLGNSTLSDQTLPAGQEGPVWTAAGEALLALVTDDGTTSLRRFTPGAAEPTTLIGGDRTVTAFAPVDDQTMLFAATTHTTPAELFCWTPEGEQPLTTCNAAWLATRQIATPERFSYQGAQGDAITGWLLLPVEQPAEPLPLIVEIHGGPHAQYGAAYFHEFQCLAGQGYAIFSCNPHGSTGRGDQFAKAILRNWGDIAMADLLAGLDLVLARGRCDPQRLGVTGGSYGGFLTNWITSHTTRFAAAVTQRSYCNALGYFGVDDIGAISDVAELGGHPWEVPDQYLALSPLLFADRVTTPTLIEHQANDYRCPLSQAEQWFAALKKRGVPTKLLIYPNESHGMSRNGQPRHRVERLQHNSAWFAEWLGAAGANEHS